jgi:gelsolin
VRSKSSVSELYYITLGLHLMDFKDEGAQGAGIFLSEIGLESMPQAPAEETKPLTSPTLYRLSDASGKVEFEAVIPASRSTLSSSDAFLLDDTANPTSPAVYIWIGRETSLTEKRLAVQYAQTYLHSRSEGGKDHYATTIVKMKENYETESFLHALGE